MYVSGVIDREKYDKITLYITASYRDRPNTRTDHAIVQLSILDTNDNPPLFTRKNYQANVYIDTEPNSYLLRVEAQDKDIDVNGQVEYSIDTNDNNNIVDIGQESGIVRWQSSLASMASRLEDRPKFMALTLMAKDTGYPALASKAILLLNFIYRNDSAPYFDAAPFKFELCEQQPVGTRIGKIAARDSNSGSQADISYRLLDGNDFFELEPYGIYNHVWLVSKFVGNYDTVYEKVWSLTVRAYAGSLSTDTVVQVALKDLNEFNPFRVDPAFKVVFNNYKNYFLTEQAAKVPLFIDQNNNNQMMLGNFISFSVTDAMGKQLVNLNTKNGEINLRPILNSNNLINTSFSIQINGNSFVSKKKKIYMVFW